MTVCRPGARQARARWGCHTVCAVAGLFLLVAPSSLRAQAGPVSAEIAIVSDYRFRGVSASERGPALQGSIDVQSNNGFVAGVWASTIADYHGSNIELDIYAGARRKLGGFDITLSAYGFVYPGGERVNTYDVEALVIRDFGAGSSETLVAIAPRQANSRRTNLYVAETIVIPVWHDGPVVRAHLGWEDGIVRSKWDMSFGFIQNFDAFQLSLMYVATNYDEGNQAGANGRAGVVGSVRVKF